MSTHRGSFDQGDEYNFHSPYVNAPNRVRGSLSSSPYQGQRPDAVSSDYPTIPPPVITSAAPQPTLATPTSAVFNQGPGAETGPESPTSYDHTSVHRRRSLLSRFTGRSSNRNEEDNKNLLSTVSEESDIIEEELETDEDDDEIVPDLKQVVSQLQQKNYMPTDAEGHLAGASSPSSGTSPSDSPRHRGYHANRARRKKSTQNKKSTSAKIIHQLRNVYTKFLSRTLLTRSFAYWLPLAVILFIPLAVGAWQNPKLTVGHVSVMWLFIWIEIVWGSLWVTRILAHYLPSVVGAILGVIAPLWVKYTSILAAMEMATTYVLWTFISFITFTPLMSDNHQAWSEKVTYSRSWQKVVNNIMVALFITSLVYFGERLVIHFLSVSFHRTRFALRIKINKEQVRLLGILLKASYQVFPQFCEEFNIEDASLTGGGTAAVAAATKRIPMMRGTSGQNIEKFVGNINRVVGGAANVIGSVAKDIRGGSKKVATQQIVSEALVHKYTSRVLADRVWKSLVLEDSEALTVDDLVDVLGEDRRFDCEEIFNKLDGDGNGNLTLEEMEQALVEIGRERKAIYRSLRDVDSAIGSLHRVLLFGVGLIAVIIFIGMLAPSVGAVLATLGSTLLALSFVFSASAQELLAACIFLFVKHPLDVGDVVKILLPQGLTQMTVKEISLLYTNFTDDTTGCLHQCSNAILNTLWVDNLSRSGNWSELTQLTLGLPETKMEDIERFKTLIQEFCLLNPRDYAPDPFVFVTAMLDLDRIQLTICVTLRSNITDGNAYGARREKLAQFLGQAIHDIPLHVPRREDTYNNPSMPFFTQPLKESTAEHEVARASSGTFYSNAIPMGYRHNNPSTAVTELPPPVEDEEVIAEDYSTKLAEPTETVTTGLQRTGSMNTTVSRTASKSRGLRRKMSDA